MYNPSTGEMCFGEALKSLRRGERLSRAAWGPHAWIKRIPYVVGDIMTVPWVVLFTGDAFVPWEPNQQDLLAEDWQEVIY